MITLLASRPGHPYFKLAIDRLPTHQNLTDTEKVLFVDQVYLEYNLTKTAHGRKEDLVVLGYPDYFLPTYDHGWHGKFQSMCSEPNKRSAAQLYVCDQLRKSNYNNQPLPRSYTNHHWFHIVTKDKTWKEQNTVNIDTLVPNNVNITERILEQHKAAKTRK